MTDSATVFVVDPDDATCDSIRSVARILNLRCETFAAGEELLAVDIADRAGCIILEIELPGINGLEIQQQLIKRGARLPIMFLTSHATLSLAVRAMRAGAIHFLEKPLREHELWDTIDEAIVLDRQRRAAADQQKQRERRLLELNGKERALLWVIADGGPKSEMAKQMGVGLRTFELRRNQLRKRLGLNSLMELVYFALSVFHREHADVHDSSDIPLTAGAQMREPVGGRTAVVTQRANRDH